MLKARQIGGVNLLTDAKGFTLYWFAPDTPTNPSATGPAPSTGRRWPGGRPAGYREDRHDQSHRRLMQATYDGHPLYTYIGDSAPGQDRGNNLNLNGGLWHDVPVASG